jgi:uncharacterized membrane protein
MGRIGSAGAVEPDDQETGGERSAHRLVQFSDGVFTVALTLLVIDIGIPNLAAGASEAELVKQLEAQLPNIFAFVLSFWVVGEYWLIHHRDFLFIRRYDGRLMLLNLLFLMTVCFIPWPTAVLGHYGGYLTTWVLYSGSMAAMGFAATALWVYASARPSLVDGMTPDLRRYYTYRALVQPIVFLASIPIAALSLTAGQFSWIAIVLVLRLLNDHYELRIDARHRPAV